MQDIIRSHAKINLALNVTGKTRLLHKIETIVAFVSLHDEISIRVINSDNHEIFFTGKFSRNIGKRNTVSKLFKILESKKLIKNTKFRIKIKKNIPTKAGLGGGSMNAANVLSYLIKKKFIHISQKELVLISNLIGSDVILGVNPHNCILNSKNKIKTYSNYKKIYALIVKPNFGCSTEKIYSKIKKFNKPKFNKPFKRMFDFNYLKEKTNSLELIAFAMHSKLKKIKFFLENLSHVEFVRMTGSGSAFVAYFRSKKRCDNGRKQFNKKYKNYWCISSKTI